MTGLSRFDFYPRDWISGTRELSDRARGVYIDLLARMYDIGRPLDYDEKDLCRFLGYRDSRQLLPVINELVTKGKVEIVDGKITNARAAREIEAAQERMDNGRKGGRPRRRNAECPPETGTSEAPARHQQARRSHVPKAGFVENQCDNEKPPSPSPSPSSFSYEKGASAPQLASQQEELFESPQPTAQAIDPAKRVYDLGRELLTAYGVAKSRQGGIVTSWRKACGNDDPALLAILAEAQAKQRDDVVAYVSGAIRARKGGAPRRNGATYRADTENQPRKLIGFVIGTPEADAEAKRWGYNA